MIVLIVVLVIIMLLDKVIEFATSGVTGAFFHGSLPFHRPSLYWSHIYVNTHATHKQTTTSVTSSQKLILLLSGLGSRNPIFRPRGPKPYFPVPGPSKEVGDVF